MNLCLTLVLLPVALLQHTRAAADSQSTLEALARRVDNTYTSQLTVEAEASSHAPNDRARPVRNGHYVAPLRLRPLSRPQLLAVSNSSLALLRLNPQETSRPEFVKVFSGGDAGREFAPWATPYGLSIYGSEQIADGGIGDGYGDGRAASLCTVDGWELQLKGSGPTPFARLGDGNAVIRSSTREFLASEAMYFLGVPTTRALSLIASYMASVLPSRVASMACRWVEVCSRQRSPVDSRSGMTRMTWRRVPGTRRPQLLIPSTGRSRRTAATLCIKSSEP